MILLTGAGGYLGQQIGAILKQRKIEYVAAPRSNVRQFANVLNGVVVHCAAIVPKTAEEYEDDEAARQSVQMLERLACGTRHYRIVFTSSMTVTAPALSAYASGKLYAEGLLQADDVILRLPGLFGLPRRSGVIYDCARRGEMRESYGPYPAMHVQDAAEYVVRAAISSSDGNPEPFAVTYGHPRLDACYGSISATFQQRVVELVGQVRREAA